MEMETKTVLLSFMQNSLFFKVTLAFAPIVLLYYWLVCLFHVYRQKQNKTKLRPRVGGDNRTLGLCKSTPSPTTHLGHHLHSLSKLLWFILEATDPPAKGGGHHGQQMLCSVLCPTSLCFPLTPTPSTTKPPPCFPTYTSIFLLQRHSLLCI